MAVSLLEFDENQSPNMVQDKNVTDYKTLIGSFHGGRLIHKDALAQGECGEECARRRIFSSWLGQDGRQVRPHPGPLPQERERADRSLPGPVVGRDGFHLTNAAGDAGSRSASSAPPLPGGEGRGEGGPR